MTRIFGHSVTLELVGLFLAEFLLAFLLTYVLLVPDTAPVAALPGLHPQAVQLAMLLAVGIAAVSVTVGLYRPDVCFLGRRLLLSTAVAGALAFPLILLASVAFGTQLGFVLANDRLFLLKLLIGWILCLGVTRVGFMLAARLGVFARPVLVLGEDEAALRTRAAIDAAGGGFRHAVMPAGDPPGLAELVALHGSAGGLAGGRPARRLWGVVVAETARGALPREALLGVRARGVRVFGNAEFGERFLRRLDTDRLPPDWLAFQATTRGPVEAWLSRALDIVVALTLLVLTAPLMLVTGLLVRLGSPGPVFYRQERVGLHGRVFTLTKFRSMRADAEAGGMPGWAAHKDPRVTRVGRFIRRTRIDELPQLLNVLSGEMSIVGPRPERPHFVSQLTGLLPCYSDRACVKPGLTGWAQVSFPYGASVEDARMKLAYDLYYVKHRSLVFDLFILLSTVRVILFQDGAR